MTEYFSIEEKNKWMSASQFKSFQKCEFATMAELRGEYVPEKTTALLVGSYVDAHFEKTLDIFRAKNPEIFTQKGDLRSEYKHAEYIIERIERDEMFMRYMSGEKQVVVTGEIAGVPFRGKIDSLHPGKCIVDMKIMRDFEPVWIPGVGKVPFVESWGYDIQGTIYQHLEDHRLPFFIAGATKEKPEPDLAIISIPQERLDYAMEIVVNNAPRYAAIKRGEIEPVRCEHCEYCRRTKVLTEIVDYREIA